MEKRGAKEVLESYGVKPSLQRMAVMQYLLDHSTHPTVEEIYSQLYPVMPTLSKTTIYNTLKLLVEKKAALMLTIDDRNTCFDGDVSLHTHFLCRKCGRVYDLPFTGDASALMKQETGHKIEEMQIYYHGVCEECLKNEIDSTKTSNII